MPDAYEIYEGRYIAEHIESSAANALTVVFGPVPAGTVRTILAATYVPSAAETKTIQWLILTGTSHVFAITKPESIALQPSYFPLVTEGMELKLFPGESIYVSRDSATVGSTMALYARFIDSPLPMYKEYEPQLDRMEGARRHGATLSGGAVRSSRSIGGGMNSPAREPSGGDKRTKLI